MHSERILSFGNLILQGRPAGSRRSKVSLTTIAKLKLNRSEKHMLRTTWKRQQETCYPTMKRPRPPPTPPSPHLHPFCHGWATRNALRLNTCYFQGSNGCGYRGRTFHSHAISPSAKPSHEQVSLTPPQTHTHRRRRPCTTPGRWIRPP